MKYIPRFKLIEAMILLKGEVQRKHLERAFQLSSPSASRTFALYHAQAPNQIVYQHSSKRLVATSTFTPSFLKDDPEEYIAAATMIANEPVIDGNRYKKCGCQGGCEWCNGEGFLTPMIKAVKDCHLRDKSDDA